MTKDGRCRLRLATKTLQVSRFLKDSLFECDIYAGKQTVIPSRRINRKDRLVYSIHDDVVTVVVVSASGHYQ
ncbi:MAG: type II toxin-antitoxin system YoeB family toxin [Bacteroidales bacterium]|nr:type II toxin-antitoxin system YoeB family toxin [Bacteroidales bacterium]